MPGLPEQIGPYRIVEILGRGGMGIVYRARHAELDREVALKVIHAAESGRADLPVRFRREAQAAGRLAELPGIVGVHDFGEDDGRLYLAMDVVEGHGLDHHIREGELTMRDGVRLVAEAAHALHGAHQLGVIHRDVKPGNILVEEPGRRARVADFGLAKRHELEGDAARLTATGAFVGTPAYLAPEQALGGTVDARTDVYSLGATLHEVLSGEAPFAGTSANALLQQTLHGDPVPLRSVAPDVPPALAAIVRQCLEKPPGDRYPSALALAEDLERWLRGEPVQARRRGTGVRLGRWLRQHRPAVAGAAAVCVLAGAAGAWAWHVRGRTADTAGGVTAIQRVTELEERAREISDAHDELMRRTLDPLTQLSRAWWSSEPLGVEHAALTELRDAAAQVAKAYPRSRVAQAWSTLGEHYAGDAEALGRLQALAAGDPLAGVLALRAALGKFARAIVAPRYASGADGPYILPWVEPDEVRALREWAEQALQQLQADPAWPLLRQRSDYEALVHAAQRAAAGEYLAAATACEPLGEHPLLGPDARFLQASVSFQAGRFETAAQVWERLGAGGNPLALSLAAQAAVCLAVERGAAGQNPRADYERAAALATRSLEARPAWLPPLNTRALARANLAAFERSEPDLESAIIDMGRIIEAGGASGTQRANRAWIRKQLGDLRAQRGRFQPELYEGAIADLEAALSGQAGDALSWNLLGAVRLGYGRRRRRYKAGDSAALEEGALAAFSRALEIDPEFAAAFMNRGGLYTDRAVAARRSGGDPLPWFEKARADLDAGLRIKGGSAPSLDTRGRLFIEWGIWRINAGGEAGELLDLAIADLEAAITANPRFHYAHQNLGVACRARAEAARRAGKPQAPWLERAVRHARDGLRLAPSDVASWTELAKTAMRWAAALQAEGGDPVPAWRTAVEGANGALKGAPKDLRSRDLRASAHVMLFRAQRLPADYEAALADYDAILQARPGEWRAQASAGSLCAVAERWPEAVRRFEAALKLQPGHPQLQQALAAARARAR